MKQAKNIGLSLLGFVLIGAGIYMIRTVPDPQGIMRALPFLLVGFGCGIFGHGLGDLLAKNDDLCVWRAHGGLCADGGTVDGHYPNGDRVPVRTWLCDLFPG